MPRSHDRRCPHQGSANLKRSPVISSSYRNRLARVTHTAPSPPRLHDYEVIGNGNPSPNGNYFQNGVHDGRPTYKREDGQWYIWFEIVLAGVIWKWDISAAAGDLSGVYWNFYCGPTDDPPGSYAPRNGAAGNPDVQLP